LDLIARAGKAKKKAGKYPKTAEGPMALKSLDLANCRLGGFIFLLALVHLL
jgi:hypothetical protein